MILLMILHIVIHTVDSSGTNFSEVVDIVLVFAKDVYFFQIYMNILTIRICIQNKNFKVNQNLALVTNFLLSYFMTRTSFSYICCLSMKKTQGKCELLESADFICGQ